MALNQIGSAYIDVHANTDTFERDLEGLDKIGDKAEADLDKTGKSFGKRISDSMVGDLARRGKQYGKAIEDATKNTIIKIRSKLDFRNAFGRRRTGIGDKIVEEVDEALTKASKPGGPISRIGSAIADAVGAGFNVSGRSPLIAILIPALLAFVGVILAALQAVNALAAVLVTLPALLTAIGLQVGVVALAFDGVGEAMKNAFAAKNAKELQLALNDLRPPAREFVKSLLPIRDLFRDLRDLAQDRFFTALGDSVGQIFKVLSIPLRHGFFQLADSMGRLFGQIADFFSSPLFVKFVNDVFPSTGRFLAQFGPAFVTLLEGLIAAADTALPFLNDIGSLLSGSLQQFGYFLKGVANDPAFQQWLNDMYETLKSVVNLFNVLIGFVVTFLDELNRAGGKGIIDELVNAFKLLIFFLESPVGQKAMEGLVHLAIFGIQSFTGLLIAILAVIGALEAFGEWVIHTAGPAILRFLQGIGEFAAELWNNLIHGITRFVMQAKERGATFIQFFATLPTRIRAAVANFGTLLLNAGRALINGLISGIREKLGALGNILGSAAAMIGNFFGNSPAKLGPLSGDGSPFHRGQRVIEGFAEGIRSEIPTLRTTTAEATSNVIFGPNSIQMQFHGPTPTESQARRVGSAVGNSAADMISVRNTRFAVRTL